MHASGTNLAICGYDAYDMAPTREAIYAEYLSPRFPFGHERVLIAMLALPEKEWPWVVFKTFEF